MAEGVTSLIVSLKPPRWEGGLPMLILCDQEGEPLPGQTQCEVTTCADGTSQVRATFVIDGAHVTLSRD